MLRREWTVTAANQFEHAQDRYHTLSPVAAAAMARRVLQATRRLGDQPGLGRPGPEPGTREWEVDQTPYLLVYRVQGDALQLLHVQAHDWVYRAEPTIERLEPWLAALISLLLHLLMVFALLFASKPTITTPQGTASGGRMKVDFIGETSQPEQPAPPSPPPTPAASPVQSTLVEQAKNPLPPEAAPRPDRVVPPRPTRPEQRPSTPQPPAPAPRRPETWTGRPPGMIEQDIGAADDGQADTSTISQGYRNDRRSAEPSMEVGGYQVYYDLRSQTQLRAWKEQGMEEIAIILPGTQYRMVCPLQIALDRGSGKCRMLPPDSPELQAIGDAREVINMMEVYRRGEPVWRGPGPYR